MPSDKVETLLAIRVTRGAGLLDNQCPGWRKLIDIEKLSMRSVKRCIVGQLLLAGLKYKLYTDYVEACKSHLGLYTREEREKHGFELDSRFREYPLLDKEWILEIEKREENDYVKNMK